MVSWITREEIDIIVAKAVAAERERINMKFARWAGEHGVTLGDALDFAAAIREGEE